MSARQGHDHATLLECEDASVVRARARSPYRPKRDVLTRVRHDLRSLVHAVTGYSDLLASPTYGALSPEQQRFVAHVRQAADQLQDMTDACIELAQPANDQEALQRQLVQLESALRYVQAGLRAARIDCVLDLPPELSSFDVLLDGALLLRALKCLAAVITAGRTEPCLLSVRCHAGHLVLRIARADAATGESCEVETLTEQLGNRDFVKLKLAEVLLGRQDVALRVGHTVDFAELVLG